MVVIVVIVAEAVRCLHVFLVLVIEVGHVPVVLIKEIVLVLHAVAVQLSGVHGYLLLTDLLVAGVLGEAAVAHQAHVVVAGPHSCTELFHVSFIGAVDGVRVLRIVVFVSTLALFFLLVEDDHLV